jgi:hypothetical protein
MQTPRLRTLSEASYATEWNLRESVGETNIDTNASDDQASVRVPKGQQQRQQPVVYVNSITMDLR